ncbi:MAG: hypothetical protein KDI88_12935 [Gammaproteobacteria bacterium]|nr:hypothetical protein [Gammaproteobacteria bacterium]
MKNIIKKLMQYAGKPRLVEFDYRDATGLHHGCCYVRCLFGGDRKFRRALHSLGYCNIRVA